MNGRLAEVLKERIIGLGGSGCGFSDLRGMPVLPDPGLRFGVTIILALDPVVIRGIKKGPNREYHDEYERANRELTRIGEGAADFIEGQGFRALLLRPTSESFDKKTLSVPFPHKTAAISSGMGWIGKCDLLVNEEFGSAFRMCTILTDALLADGNRIQSSKCGQCRSCIDACPAGAPTGRDWKPGTHRDELVDIFACYRFARSISDKMGSKHTICGICIESCPWTRKYINSRTGDL